MKKICSIILVLTMVLGILTACGQDDSKKTNDGTKDQGTASNNDANANKKPAEKEREKLIISLDKMPEDVKLARAIEEVQEMEKYSHVDFEVHGKEADFLTTMPITVAGGEQRDLVAVAQPILQQQWADAGTIQPLTKMIESLGLDFEKEFGPYAANAMNNGEYYTIPHNITKWALYYNKKIFDEAGIPYPDPKVPMTWDDYRALAKQLTSGEGAEKKYGALYLTWPMFWYGEAIMTLGGGQHFYNEEGLSNIEDPAFAHALQKTFDMMHVDKSIPTHADVVISKTKPTAFMNGQYGMAVQGGWILSWAADKENYPRDFEIGIAPMPVDEGTSPKTWGIVNGFAIAQTSANPELALEVGMDLSRLSAQYAMAAPEANQTIEQNLLYTGMGDKLGAEGMTTEVLLDIFANPDTAFLTEKVTGANAPTYEKVINEEVEKFLVEEQDLDTTINNIKARGDKKILD